MRASFFMQFAISARNLRLNPTCRLILMGIGAFALCGAPLPTFASTPDIGKLDITVAGYKNYKSKDAASVDALLFIMRLAGVGDGLLTANAQLQVNGQSMLFCVPERMTFSPKVYLDILDQAIAKAQLRANVDTIATDVLLTYGLMERYPCKKSDVGTEKGANLLSPKPATANNENALGGLRITTVRRGSEVRPEYLLDIPIFAALRNLNKASLISAEFLLEVFSATSGRLLRTYRTSVDSIEAQKLSPLLKPEQFNVVKLAASSFTMVFPTIDNPSPPRTGSISSDPSDQNFDMDKIVRTAPESELSFRLYATKIVLGDGTNLACDKQKCTPR